MTKVDELLAKHPNLTKPEALKIIADKIERKNKKRAEKNHRSETKKALNEAGRAERDRERESRRENEIGIASEGETRNESK